MPTNSRPLLVPKLRYFANYSGMIDDYFTFVTLVTFVISGLYWVDKLWGE